jgi:hypothetical protein
MYFPGGISLFSAQDQLYYHRNLSLVFKISFSKKELKILDVLNILNCKDGLSLDDKLLQVFSGECFGCERLFCNI